MTNLQLFIAVGFPSLFVLLGILLNRQDYLALRVEMNQLRSDVRLEIGALRAEFRAEMNDLRSEMHKELIAFRDMIHEDMISLHDRVAKVENR